MERSLTCVRPFRPPAPPRSDISLLTSADSGPRAKEANVPPLDDTHEKPTNTAPTATSAQMPRKLKTKAHEQTSNKTPTKASPTPKKKKPTPNTSDNRNTQHTASSTNKFNMGSHKGVPKVKPTKIGPRKEKK